MIALDSSAVVAIALEEPEAVDFNRLIVTQEALIGTPTLFEIHLVLSQKSPGSAEEFLTGLLERRSIHPVQFNLPMFRLAQSAFERYGKGKRRPAKLNFGDCMAYAVAKFHDVPLLYKGDDFRLTDIRPAVP
jgi:ribonuclease VapC